MKYKAKQHDIQSDRKGIANQTHKENKSSKVPLVFTVLSVYSCEIPEMCWEQNWSWPLDVKAGTGLLLVEFSRSQLLVPLLLLHTLPRCWSSWLCHPTKMCVRLSAWAWLSWLLGSGGRFSNIAQIHLLCPLPPKKIHENYARCFKM